ncbi:alpha/beta fold hydrolase [Arcobacter roscoffensis]|uniref:Alpha/beta fold hydrolase n=1 Tax=Arcobacter roscoffensis TaxID=2961520 RepID=A0ABY5E6N1_9BACT|nr:alpha/beta hydrolase [Arcobacter roscoffensis]UTJ06820.1 alpha/beta fold hydrolase [Arcobacter roscoffensis]
MSNPEIANSINTGNYNTNYHDLGEGEVVLFIHGSGPGVSAFANWRLAMPQLAKNFRVIAPDMVGFGYSDRPNDITYSMDEWVEQAINLMDALKIEKFNIVGNSFGGGLALCLAIKYPNRVNKMVLMGAMGVDFEITAGLDQAWGYTPSIENMKALLDTFAYSRELVTDDLAKMRYEASIRPGFQESFSSMFPEPRQNSVKSMASDEKEIASIDKDVLIIHGRDDKVIPFENSIRLHNLIEKSQLHGFGQCGHWSQIEHKDRFNKLLEDFFLE